jgi:hypothetical protein
LRIPISPKKSPAFIVVRTLPVSLRKMDTSKCTNEMELIGKFTGEIFIYGKDFMIF